MRSILTRNLAVFRDQHYNTSIVPTNEANPAHALLVIKNTMDNPSEPVHLTQPHSSDCDPDEGDNEPDGAMTVVRRGRAGQATRHAGCGRG